MSPLLKMRGFYLLTPNLIGMGDGAPASSISLMAWVDQVADLLADDLPSPVIVAHSRVCIVASAVAKRCPDRLAGLIYVAGSLIPDGSIATHGPQHNPEAPKPLVIEADGMASLPCDAARLLFLNATPEPWATEALDHLVPEPIQLFQTPVHVTDARFGRAPRAYIRTKNDNAVPFAAQNAMLQALPCSPVVDLDSDHSPFLSQPLALADAISTICQAFQPSV